MGCQYGFVVVSSPASLFLSVPSNHYKRGHREIVVGMVVWVFEHVARLVLFVVNVEVRASTKGFVVSSLSSVAVGSSVVGIGEMTWWLVEFL